MIKLVIFCVLSLLVFFSSSQKNKPEINEEIKTAFRSETKTFIESLKSVLIIKQTNGILKAVSIQKTL